MLRVAAEMGQLDVEDLGRPPDRSLPPSPLEGRTPLKEPPPQFSCQLWVWDWSDTQIGRCLAAGLRDGPRPFTFLE